MNNLSTRELLYLDDTCKLFETISRNCDFAANNTVDPQLKTFMQTMASEHRQWISSTASIVTNKKVQ